MATYRVLYWWQPLDHPKRCLLSFFLFTCTCLLFNTHVPLVYRARAFSRHRRERCREIPIGTPWIEREQLHSKGSLTKHIAIFGLVCWTFDLMIDCATKSGFEFIFLHQCGTTSHITFLQANGRQARTWIDFPVSSLARFNCSCFMVPGKLKPPSDKMLPVTWNRSGKEQTDNNFYKNDDSFKTKFARHVSVVQRPSSVESRINLKLHLTIIRQYSPSLRRIIVLV